MPFESDSDEDDSPSEPVPKKKTAPSLSVPPPCPPMPTLPSADRIPSSSPSGSRETPSTSESSLSEPRAGTSRSVSPLPTGSRTPTTSVQIDAAATPGPSSLTPSRGEKATSLQRAVSLRAAELGVTATDARMLELLEAILLQVTKNSKLLGRLLASKENERIADVEQMHLDMIPLKDYTEAQELDRRLGEDVTLKNALVHHLSLLGGQDLNKIVKGILKELMTKDLSQQCNFKGHRGPKKAFSVLANILNVTLSKFLKKVLQRYFLLPSVSVHKTGSKFCSV
ncbi:hypothetical protein HOLleu_03377 [Holothuria leucospilota]|uniref:DUF4806 domain-containing protein n=1 Tax=Holothuria leucospilota TaxID=206669 RepID=A0A9Q1CSH5_HOLLE|nr:hypothetical protein HOLleu_03377 [Holothuria leucospilota]